MRKQLDSLGHRMALFAWPDVSRFDRQTRRQTDGRTDTGRQHTPR